MHIGEPKILAILGLHGLSEPAALREGVHVHVGNSTNVYQAASEHPLAHGVLGTLLGSVAQGCLSFPHASRAEPEPELCTFVLKPCPLFRIPS